MHNALYPPLSSLFVAVKGSVVLRVLLVALIFMLILAFFMLFATPQHMLNIAEGPWPVPPSPPIS